MFIITLIAYLLCLFDFICTNHWIGKYDIEIEANPIGRLMFSVGGGALAFFVKVVFTLITLIFLYQFRNISLGKAGILIIFLAYLAVAIYHIIILIKAEDL